MTARVYSYGAARPHDGHELVAAQMRLAHEYRNALVELERDRRERVESALREHFPEIVDAEAEWLGLEAELTAHLDAVKARNAEARRRTGTAEDRATTKRLRTEKAESAARWKATKREAYGDPAARKALKAELDAGRDPATVSDSERQAAYGPPWFRAILDGIEADFHATWKAQRAAFVARGLYWGTYLIVEDAFERSRKDAKQPLRFLRWTGDGAIAVQLQGGLPWPDAMAGTDTRLRVRMEPIAARPRFNKRGQPLPQADPHSARSRKKAQAVAWLRIGTAPDGRAPVWAKVRCHLHRHPPADAVVKWAKLYRRFVGQRETWCVQFTLVRDEWEQEAAGGGAVGLDLGWRLVDDGLRVAYYAGDDGETGELVLPHAWLAVWRKVDDLRAIRDKEFDAARLKLGAWLKTVAAPEWLSEALDALSRWRSASRLGRVVRRWRGERFEGDHAIFAAMEAWRAQDRHLHDWAEALRGKVIARRNDLYRKWALRLARRYHEVYVEATNWANLQERPAPDAEKSEDAAAKRRRIAAVAELVGRIKEKAAVVTRVPAPDTTRRCHACGTINDFDAQANLFFTCVECEELWDQDHNAALNLRDANAVAAG